MQQYIKKNTYLDSTWLRWLN